jgi:fatty acid desaturase
MKILELLNRITTLKPDKNQHIVGAIYTTWISLIITAFFGRTAGLWSCFIFFVLIVLWEVYGRLKHLKPFSFKDIGVALLVIIPFALMLLK